ncbi:germin-like protein 12-2 [Cinnamomum micranthum f. kanehirae]|uniref:Germin-like protein 12-2 n=1 Tax=Cinnamomum micranthum f. kanehirae TaxID=337451 RepID=A0A3S3QAS6_9MAGN|nr:germin-like protein 12-2 [Cinnamomum micranthum f. kanehirae]
MDCGCVTERAEAEQRRESRELRKTPQGPIDRIWVGSIGCLSVLVNGCVCKNPKLVKADDFFLLGLDKLGNTMNKVGSNVTQVNVAQIRGLNTIGISLVRIDRLCTPWPKPSSHITLPNDLSYEAIG